MLGWIYRSCKRISKLMILYEVSIEDCHFLNALKINQKLINNLHGIRVTLVFFFFLRLYVGYFDI